MTGVGVVGIVIMGLLYVLFLVVMVLFLIRRLHDVNVSGHWAWLGLGLFVPLLNLLVVLASLVLLFIPGTAGPNRFGPARVTPSWEKVLGWIYVGLVVLGIVLSIVFIAVFIAAMNGPSSM